MTGQPAFAVIAVCKVDAFDLNGANQGLTWA